MNSNNNNPQTAPAKVAQPDSPKPQPIDDSKRKEDQAKADTAKK